MEVTIKTECPSCGGSGTILDAPTASSWISYAEFEQKIPAPRAE